MSDHILGGASLGIEALGGFSSSSEETTFNYTFSALNNINRLDWNESNYESFLLVTYFMPEDMMFKFWTPYIYTFLKVDEFIVTDVNDDVVEDEFGEAVTTTPSLLMNTFWNWRNNEFVPITDLNGDVVIDNNGDVVYAIVLPDLIQVYRNRDNYLTAVAKNRIRGKGRSLQLKYRSEGPADFDLLGWGLYFTKNTKL